MQLKTLCEGEKYNIQTLCRARLKIDMDDRLWELSSPQLLATFSIGYFLRRKESGGFWLTAASSMKKEMNFEVKACNPNPLIQRHLHTLRERERPGVWLGLLNIFTQAQIHTHIFVHTHCSKFRAVPLRNEAKLHCMLMIKANHVPKTCEHTRN